MKKIVFTMLMGLSLLSVSTFGAAFKETPRVFVGGGMGLGGFVGLGTKTYDVLVAFANSSNDSTSKTELTQFTLAGDIKSTLDSKGTYFTVGGLVAILSGKSSGTTIDSGTAIGLAVGIQKELSDDVILDARILPISITSIKAGSTVNTTSFFNTTSVAVSYLF